MSDDTQVSASVKDAADVDTDLDATEGAVEGGAADGTGSDPAEATPRRWRGRPVGWALLGVVLLVACVALAVLYWQERQREALRESAAAEAGRLVVQLATYDHETVADNVEAVTAEATEGFAEEYREVAGGLEELLVNGEGSSTATAVHSAVESLDGDRAVVLVFLDQEVSNVTVPEGRVDASRMVVDLVRDGDGWLLDKAELA